jgi:ATP-dependent Clp protease ATP-binding subunit ClpA
MEDCVFFCPLFVTEPRTDLGPGPLLTIIDTYRPKKVYLVFTPEALMRQDQIYAEVHEQAKISGIENFEFTAFIDNDKIITDKLNQNRIFHLYNTLLRSIIAENPGKKILLNVTSGTLEMRTALINVSVFLRETFPVQSSLVGPDNIVSVKPFENHTIKKYIFENRLLSLIEAYDYNGAYKMIEADKNFAYDDDKLFSEKTYKLVEHAYHRYYNQLDAAYKAYKDDLFIITDLTPDIKDVTINLFENFVIQKYKSKVYDNRSFVLAVNALAIKLAIVYISKIGGDTSKFLQLNKDAAYIYIKIAAPDELTERLRKVVGGEYNNKTICNLRDMVAIVDYFETVQNIPKDKRHKKYFEKIRSYTEKRNQTAHSYQNDNDIVARPEKIWVAMEQIFLFLSEKLDKFDLYDIINKKISDSLAMNIYEKIDLPASVDAIEAEDGDGAFFDDGSGVLSFSFTIDEEDESDEDKTLIDDLAMKEYLDELKEREEYEKRKKLKEDDKTEVKKETETTTVKIDDLLINLNRECESAEPIASERDNVIDELCEALVSKDKPNALVVGSAGTGKTTIVRELARRLAIRDSRLPSKLINYRIFELNLNNLISGTKYRGDLEEKLQLVLKMAGVSGRKIIFIDEIHQLMSSQQGFETISQTLKPALTSGKFCVIGATTLQESITLSRDPAFNRRFTRITLNELSAEETFGVLKSSIHSYEEHFETNFDISDDVLKTVVKTADSFTSAGSHRPDNAITLLSRTLSKAYTENEKKDDIRIQLNSSYITSRPTPVITEEFVKKTAMQLLKGNEERPYADYKELRKNLSSIKGQDHIIDEIIDIIRRDERGLFPRKKPLTMLFTGSSGVGKTEITKIISEYVTHKEPIVLNMTEYADSHSISKIVGSAPGVLGSDSKAELPFDCLESNPYQFILLDEFEKCAKDVQRLFMSAFDEGLLKTNRGTVIDFSKAIIIATSNAASENIRKYIGFINQPNKIENKDLVAVLEKSFDKELIARFEHLLNFNNLTEENYMEIVENVYKTEAARIRGSYSDITLPELPDDETLEKIRKGYVLSLGARPVYRIVKRYIEDLLMEKDDTAELLLAST